MYYRIKNHIFYLPSILNAYKNWGCGGPTITINYCGDNHPSTIDFSTCDERDKEFDILCEKLLELEK